MSFGKYLSNICSKLKGNLRMTLTTENDVNYRKGIIFKVPNKIFKWKTENDKIAGAEEKARNATNRAIDHSMEKNEKGKAQENFIECIFLSDVVGGISSSSGSQNERRWSRVTPEVPCRQFWTQFSNKSAWRNWVPSARQEHCSTHTTITRISERWRKEPWEKDKHRLSHQDMII